MNEPWPHNPLVTLIRFHSKDIIADAVESYAKEHGFVASPFDLALQVMIAACSYKPEEVWQGSTRDVAIASELVAKGAAREAAEVLGFAIDHGQVKLNKKLVTAIARHQLRRLHELQATSLHAYGLVAYYAESLAVVNKPGAALAELQLCKSESEDSLPEAYAFEKASRQRVVFRPLDPAVGQSYARALHYLHAGRNDDILAFGAFLEDEAVPFAWVSYAPVGRKYKQELLSSTGIDPGLSLELTRAWNDENSPKNTMSMLYAYAHSAIQHKRLARTDASVQAILTAVNPNLGFRGSAFRAVGFGLIGEKPTTFHYLVDAVGKRSLVLRRNLADLLQRSVSAPKYMTAVFPLLPTKELAVILDGQKRLRPTSDLRVVSEVAYYEEVPALRIKSSPTLSY